MKFKILASIITIPLAVCGGVIVGIAKFIYEIIELTSIVIFDIWRE